MTKNTERQKKNETPDTWVDNYGDDLYRFALSKLRNTSQAEDFVQETFMTAFKKRETFEGRSSIKTWLFTILKNKIIDYYRSSRYKLLDSSNRSLDETLEINNFNQFGVWKTYVTDWSSDPLLSLENKDFQKALIQCMSKLPEKHQKAFTMRFIEELETKDICNALEITSSNYWMILYRSRMALRDCLEKNWTKG